MSDSNNSYNKDISPRVERSKIESPIEEIFIEQLEKHLNGFVEVVPQYEVNTNAGKFRLDFLIIYNGKKIAIECDGKEFHDEWRDEWRDALILGNNEIDTIYRFRGKDIVCLLNECIHVMFHYDKKIFNDRYSEIYTQLVAKEVLDDLERNPGLKETKNDFSIRAMNDDGEESGWLNLIVIRRSIKDKTGYWKELYEFSKKHLGLNIDQIIKKRKTNRY